MTKTAWVYPGQGSQKVGMGSDLIDLPFAQARFNLAAEILNWSILEKCQGSEEELSRTLYTQPCLFVIESILTDLLQEKGAQADLVAGHSLGEYSALYAAKVFDFTTGLKLVQQRAQLMDSVAGGKMAALMKFDRPQLELVLSSTPDVVLANDNSTEQVVISGTPEAVDEVLAQVKAKRTLPLKVSGAFHSHLMADASATFNHILEQANFQDAQVPVLSNVNPTPTTNAEELKIRLSKQMTGGVRWREIMLQLPQEAIAQVIEVGPGNVLTGLIKRTCPDLTLKNIASLQDFDN
jgi:[acyl-carrier-protein] S-malonyltransferase